MKEIITSNSERTLSYKPLIDLHLSNVRGIFIGDLHIKYFHKESLNTALVRGIDRKIDFIYLNGDIIDFYGLSVFNKDKTRQFIKPEIDLTVNVLKEIRKAFPNVQIFYKLGNHEDRLINFIWNKSPELTGLKCLNIESLLCFEELEIKKIESGQIAKVGKLFVAHGHEFKGTSNQVNTARNIRLKAGKNILQGHWHRTNDDFSTSIDGEVVGSYTVGCLSELNPQYAPFNQWNHGFAEIQIDKYGNYILDNRKIINGKIY